MFTFYSFFQNLNCTKLDEIKRAFCAFGSIEAIEVVNDSETNVEAYVLFEKSESAFEAFQAHRNGVKSTSNLFYVVPANTWHQPYSMPLCNPIDPRKCFILKLNDDCLIEMFKYLDLETLVKLSNVCTRFRTLLNTYNFPKIKIYTIYVYHPSVSVLRQTMKCIGPHLMHLYLRYQKYGEDPENYLDEEHVERTTYKILQYITLNLIKLTIRIPQKPSDKMMKLFIPAFRQITFLEWDAEFDCDTIECLQNSCPHLETLILRRRNFSCQNAHNTARLHWPSLKSLEIFQYMAELNLPCQRFFERFIQENSQLKRLKLTNVNHDLFQIIAQCSRNLEHLEMLQNFDLCSIHTKPTLDLLNNLNSLRICIIRVKITEFLPDVVNQIRILSQIQRLELIVLLHNYAPPSMQYEYFPLAHQWSEITIEGNDMKLRIGENFANIKFDAGRTTLVNIFNTNNPRESSHKRLRRDVRHVFKESNMFFPNVHESFSFKNIDCRQFIHVNCTM